PRHILLQMAVGDRTVPNPTTEQIIRAGALQPFVSLYRHDLVITTLPPRFANPHGFLTMQDPEVAATARAAQEQIARFFLSDGRTIERPTPHPEVPYPPGPRRGRGPPFELSRSPRAGRRGLSQMRGSRERSNTRHLLPNPTRRPTHRAHRGSRNPSPPEGER